MERQYGTSLDQIRKDHVERYKFAASILDKGDRVLDAACGAGYGSRILHDAGMIVDGVDASNEAIDYAEKHWPGPGYIRGRIEEAAGMRKWYDAIVSFETLEHLKDPSHALQMFRKKTDYLICSVPNEDNYPFNPKNFEADEFPHFRHFQPVEIETLLNSAGFVVEQWGHQRNKQSPVEMGQGGMFLVCVCGGR